VLPRDRHPAAGNHLGPDDLAGTQIPHQCLVAVVLAGAGDHPDHHVAQPPVELDADRTRSGPALASRNERPQEWLTIFSRCATCRSNSTPPPAWSGRCATCPTISTAARRWPFSAKAALENPSPPRRS